MTIWIIYAITTLYKFVLDWWDIKYRMCPPHIVNIIFLIPSFIAGVLKYGWGARLFINFFALSIIYIAVELILGDGKNTVVGGGDIVCAPMYTVWMDYYLIFFVGFTIIGHMIYNIKPIRKTISKLYVGDDYNEKLPATPLLPVMHISEICSFIVIGLLNKIVLG